MAIRRLSYRLDQEPDTGAVRLIPAQPVRSPHEEPRHRIAVTGLGPAVEDVIGTGSELSYTLLPDGGRLLCATLSGRRVEALHLSAGTPGPGSVWPIDTWRSATWEPDAGEELGAGFVESELPVTRAHFDSGRLVEFARARAERVAPFLTDVRRLFADPAGRQIVLVEEDPEAVAHWVALACASLPEIHVPALTFTTWTTDPHRAPQQIIGIGPGVEFDRDDATVEYLYRVHDATGGRQSPPAAADAWAQLTAERWISGSPPAPGTGARADDAFALIPLISGGGGGDRPGAAALTGADLAGLGGDSLHAVLDAFTKSVTRGEADAATLDRLEALCREVEGEQALAARPLALALVKHRLDTSRTGGALPGLAAFEGLPLGKDAWRELREEYGQRADDALRGALRGPIPAWAEPLRLALAVGADNGPGIAEAMDRLADALLHPEQHECAHAVRLLDDLGHLPFIRRVLRMLIVDLTSRKLDRVRELARSPQGVWLQRNIEQAPPTVRLAAAAVLWSGAPDHLRGAELFEALVGLLPGRRVGDVATLRLLWRLVWRSKVPDHADVAWVARTCTPRLVVDAGHGRGIIHWVRDPDRCDPELVAYARDMRGDAQLGVADRATADLLVTAQDLADGRLGVTRASVGRLGELGRKAGPLSRVLRLGVDERVGRALARADPVDVRESHGLRLLVAASPELLSAYRAYFTDAPIRDGMVRELPDRPAELAAYYYLWRPRRRSGVTDEWRAVAEELLGQVLAPVVAHMDEHHLGRVATVLQRENQDLQGWTAWRHRIEQQDE
ncbi:GTPase-associated protein 1-related protein [Streptomyces sp. NPDC050703]|uniref:GTPase-associated protein 1-related protein n=1 Tax=Streptomyces sp. NPDC050703 TaxID=3157218 RepID=UPI003421AF08